MGIMPGQNEIIIPTLYKRASWNFDFYMKVHIFAEFVCFLLLFGSANPRFIQLIQFQVQFPFNPKQEIAVPANTQASALT
jgi:hypothetical protein